MGNDTRLRVGHVPRNGESHAPNVWSLIFWEPCEIQSQCLWTTYR